MNDKFGDLPLGRKLNVQVKDTFHLTVGEIFKRLTIYDATVKLDSKCGGDGRIEVCDVDLGHGGVRLVYADGAAIVDGVGRVLLESEESEASCCPASVYGNTICKLGRLVRGKGWEFPLEPDFRLVQFVQIGSEYKEWQIDRVGALIERETAPVPGSFLGGYILIQVGLEGLRDPEVKGSILSALRQALEWRKAESTDLVIPSS